MGQVTHRLFWQLYWPESVGDNPQLQVLPINVTPAAINFLEAAILVKTMALAVNFEAGDEFNESGVIIGPPCCCRSYAEPQPPLTLVQAYFTGPCIRVPGGQ